MLGFLYAKRTSLSASFPYPLIIRYSRVLTLIIRDSRVLTLIPDRAVVFNGFIGGSHKEHDFDMHTGANPEPHIAGAVDAERHV